MDKEEVAAVAGIMEAEDMAAAGDMVAAEDTEAAEDMAAAGDDNYPVVDFVVAAETVFVGFAGRMVVLTGWLKRGLAFDHHDCCSFYLPTHSFL